MNTCPRAVRILAAAAILALPAPILAQTPSPPAAAPDPTAFTWSGGIGLETVALRDIARTTRPVTASPVKWKGSGPVLRVRFSGENMRRRHQLDVGVGSSGDFEYEGPVLTTRTAAADRARIFDARYEYRRYPFRDLLHFLDAGFGVEGLGARVSFEREVAGGVGMNEARWNAGVGGSVAARLGRGRRIGGEVVWTNGLVIGHRNERWTSGVVNSGGGGGWLTTLAAEGNIRVADAARIFVRYTTSGEGFLASHRSYSLSRTHLALGVTYGG